MKKIISIFIALSVLLMLCACNAEKEEDQGKKYVLETIVIGTMEFPADEFFKENPNMERDHYSLVIYDDGVVVLTEGEKKKEYHCDSDSLWSDSSNKKAFYWDDEKALFPLDDNTLLVFERE